MRQGFPGIGMVRFSFVVDRNFSLGDMHRSPKWRTHESVADSGQAF